MDLYFRQLLAGRDFATDHPVAGMMRNYVYLVGDRETGECVAVDPAWDVPGLLAIVEGDGMRLTGALATHYHPDHVGGDLFGNEVPGLSSLMALSPVKVHAHRLEVPGILAVTGLSQGDVVPVESGDTLAVGGVEIRFIHTPGHTPGSQCFLVDGGRLVSGDTLFIGACGRVDLPGSDPEAMYETLTQRLAKLSDDVVLFPGHDYGAQPSASMGAQKRTNRFLAVPTLDAFLRLMAR